MTSGGPPRQARPPAACTSFPPTRTRASTSRSWTARPSRSASASRRERSPRSGGRSSQRGSSTPAGSWAARPGAGGPTATSGSAPGPGISSPPDRSRVVTVSPGWWPAAAIPAGSRATGALGAGGTTGSGRWGSARRPVTSRRRSRSPAVTEAFPTRGRFRRRPVGTGRGHSGPTRAPREWPRPAAPHGQRPRITESTDRSWPSGA